MSKILILTASTGAGHNQAANNLKLEFEEKAHEVVIVDLFKSTDKAMNTVITEGYNFLAKIIPDAYGFIYNLLDKKKLNDYLLKNAFILIEKRISRKIAEIDPAIVISTHPFGVPIICALKQKNKTKIPFIQVVTDFKAHYTYVDRNVDAYITASEFTREGLIERGIAPDKIFAYGIPTKEEFQTKPDRVFDTNHVFKLLIMGGSMGLKPMEDSVDILIHSDLNIHMSVVCGNNEALKDKLTEKFKDKIEEGRLEVLGFINNVHEYMDNCNLIITKPGGLTTTEAINKCIPMLIPFAIPGQEQENTSFMVENKMALEIREVSQLPTYIKQLIEQPEIYMEMVQNMTELSGTYSIDKIIELAEQMIAIS
ncbi:MAG: glycosyltransferase [Bacillota bacterium]|nr:glycosyltransferase [Bacillota bacterium]